MQETRKLIKKLSFIIIMTKFEMISSTYNKYYIYKTEAYPNDYVVFHFI